MRNLLYTCLVLAANAAGAGVVDPALLTGDMGKLVVTEPRALPAEGLVDLKPGELGALNFTVGADQLGGPAVSGIFDWK